MTKCNIDFYTEICEGSIGTKEEVMMLLKGEQYDYEGIHRVRNTAEHKWIYVKVYSLQDYFFGTSFVCYPAE